MSPRLTIGQVAARSGFSTSTLRYYDDIGLVEPSGRSDSGYRQYDERSLDRLGFVARAKELGCTIDEIRDLLVAWDGGQCGPVQDRLRRLVTGKVDATLTRVAEAELLLSDLRASADALERHRPVGACDDSCGCVTVAPTEANVEWVTMGLKPEISCSLETSELGGRISEWQTLLESVTHRERLRDGIRLAFEPSLPHAELMRLVTAEQSCCTFFEFAITVDSRGVALEVRAAPEALAVVEELFGPVSVGAGRE